MDDTVGHFGVKQAAHPSFLRKQESIWKVRIDRQPDGFPLARE
jgi:hypothetical protein